jgi:galactose mutarotase-like enzyme
VLTLVSHTLSAAISCRGAELSSLRTSDGGEWLWQGDPKFWDYRSPILFPVVGRSPRGEISIAGRSYPMDSHGFARTSEFQVVHADAATARLRLVDTLQTRASFPFAFQLDIGFALESCAVSVIARITNTGAASMPCSIGFHPAFSWPLPGGEGRQHRVTVDGDTSGPVRRLDENGFVRPQPQPTPFHDGVMEARQGSFAPALFLDRGWGGRASFGLPAGPEIALHTAGFDYLGLWAPDGAPFLGLEPCQGLACVAGASNAIETRPGIMLVPPGDCYSARVRITITPRQVPR